MKLLFEVAVTIKKSHAPNMSRPASRKWLAAQLLHAITMRYPDISVVVKLKKQ